jgi:HSP20 family protein
MALVKWNPWTELETFKRDFDRLFDLHRPGLFGNGGDSSGAMWIPHMDVQEADTAYRVEVDLPGMAIEDIDVQVEGTTLMIAGDRKSEASSQTGHYAHHERRFGKFQRAFTLPAAVKVDEVNAAYANGILTVTVPKAAEARTKRIAIQAA